MSWFSNNNSHNSHNQHNNNINNGRSAWSLVFLYMMLTAVTITAFYKGCNRNPYKLCAFSNYSVDGVVTRQDNIIRLYDEDSVLYVNDARYPLITIQKQLINNDNTWILGSYLCVEYFDTIYIGVESKNGFIKSVTLETDIIGINNEINPNATTIESYY
jgi:hypothetical protein